MYPDLIMLTLAGCIRCCYEIIAKAAAGGCQFVRQFVLGPGNC